MQKYSLQKRIGPYTVDKSLFQQIENYINRNIPRVLLLNLEKGNDRPLSSFVSISLQRDQNKQVLRTIDEYGFELFDSRVEEVTIELSHTNAFNFWGQKVIVLIMTFDVKSGYCDMSLALNDEEPREKIHTLEKGLRSILNRHRKSLPLSRFFKVG